MARVTMLSARQQLAKRTFDVTVATAALAATWWIIAAAALAARRSTGGSGIFRQLRVGRGGQTFTLLKIRTMSARQPATTNVTTAADPRVTRLGRWLRQTKIDELPQLLNVLRGEMSLVGPRPDVPEMLPLIRKLAPEVLQLRPGITGPASLKYRDEERLLAAQTDPEAYNAAVIFPDKLRINCWYLQRWSLLGDVRCVWRTIVGGPPAPASLPSKEAAPSVSHNDNRAAA